MLLLEVALLYAKLQMTRCNSNSFLCLFYFGFSYVCVCCLAIQHCHFKFWFFLCMLFGYTSLSFSNEGVSSTETHDYVQLLPFLKLLLISTWRCLVFVSVSVHICFSLQEDDFAASSCYF
jgi:hypothetical protein